MTPNPLNNRARTRLPGGEMAADEMRTTSSDTTRRAPLPDGLDAVDHDQKEGDSRAELASARSKVVDPGSLTPSFSITGGGPSDSVKSANQRGFFAAGSRFGVYVVGECIGEGGMARVYQAEHAGLRRQVALKVLTDGFARDPDGRERFVREARIAAAIKHPNVVNIFDVGVHDDIPYLVMEFLEGQDLEKMLDGKGAIEESLIIDIMVPVVAGLLAVHDAGIVHRDLKPGNIFLARGRYSDVEPKLLDFGISKAPGTEQLKLTANRAFMGTPFYISPEALHGGEMTPLSDQYSLGVVMYECATGIAPFRASSLVELSNLIGSGQYTPPTTHKPELSQRLARIIERAMSLEPQQRFKDMREMGCELLTLAGQRTRITWGLSFGDVGLADAKDTGPPRSETREGDPAPGETPTTDRTVRWRGALVLFGISPLVLLLAALIAWRFGAFAAATEERGAIRPPNVAPATRIASPPEPAMLGANTAAAEPARPPQAEAPLQAVPAVPLPRAGVVANPPEAMKSPASADQSTHPAAPPIPRSRAAQADLDGTLPAASGHPRPKKSGDPELGANNAPIFD